MSDFERDLVEDNTEGNRVMYASDHKQDHWRNYPARLAVKL